MPELIEYTSATKMAAVYRRSIARIRRVLVELADECEAMNAAFDEAYAFNIDLQVGGERMKPGVEAADRISDYMKRRAWSALVEKLGIRKIMSSTRQAELDEALHPDRRRLGYGEQPPDLPEIDEDTIYDVLSGMVQSADEFLQEAITEEYDWWKPRKSYANYKRNSEFRLNRRVIRPWMVEREWNRWRPRYHNESHVTALDRIFHALDGCGIPPGHYGPLGEAIRSCGPEGRGETVYFVFRCCKNGNLHLEFKRQDLLDRFNEIAGRNRLPNPEEAA